MSKNTLMCIGLAVFILSIGLITLIPEINQLKFSQQKVSQSHLSGQFDQSISEAYFNNKSVNHPSIPQTDQQRQVMGDTTGTHKWIEVDLTNQRLYAYEDGYKVFDFLVSTGKWGRTPIGTFDIWIKLRYTTMSGGNKALGTYYYLPNVPFTMFFYNTDYPKWVGYGIHGTYWHENFGHPMSHGCINMKNEEVEQLYYWAQPDLPDGKTSTTATVDNPGTKVYIYGVAPKE